MQIAPIIQSQVLGARDHTVESAHNNFRDGQLDVKNLRLVVVQVSILIKVLWMELPPQSERALLDRNAVVTGDMIPVVISHQLPKPVAIVGGHTLMLFGGLNNQATR